MKYICKAEEPEKFKTWKNLENEDWKPSWKNFQAPEKTLVHEALLQEQGYICCYCGRSISKQSSHIEHLKPRTSYPEEALSYTNLLASCQVEKSETDPIPVPVHCGHKKGDWYDENLMVSPLERSCFEFFRYSGSGEILPSKEEDKESSATATISRLGLNIDKLKAMRRGVIDGILQNIEELTDIEIQNLVRHYSSPNVDGQYTQGCAVIVYILNQYLIGSTAL